MWEKVDVSYDFIFLIGKKTYWKFLAEWKITKWKFWILLGKEKSFWYLMLIIHYLVSQLKWCFISVTHNNFFLLFVFFSLQCEIFDKSKLFIVENAYNQKKKSFVILKPKMTLFIFWCVSYRVCLFVCMSSLLLLSDILNIFLVI